MSKENRTAMPLKLRALYPNGFIAEAKEELINFYEKHDGCATAFFMNNLMGNPLFTVNFVDYCFMSCKAYLPPIKLEMIEEDE